MMDPSEFRKRLLMLNSDLGKSSRAYGSYEGIDNMEQLARPHVQWYFESSSGHDLLKSFLLDLDEQVRVNPQSDYCKHIYEGVYDIMNTIKTRIAEKNPSLDGQLVRMGSAHNNMKIESPNEFDFTYEIFVERLFGNCVHIKHMSTEKNKIQIYLDIEDETKDLAAFDIVSYPDDPELDSLLTINGAKDDLLYKSAIGKQGNDFVLNTEAVAFAFYNVLDEVVSTLDLPANWSHCGYLYPYYSGIRINIPAYRLQFTYTAPGGSKPLFVAVDFAPVLVLPTGFQFSFPDLVDQHLSNHGFVKYQWQRLDRGCFKGLYNSLAEESWLATYAADSIPKLVISVCKALHNLVELNIPIYVSRSIAEHVVSGRRATSGKTKHILPFRDYMYMTYALDSLKSYRTDMKRRYAILTDIYENVGGHDYVSSYIFKRIVMTLMAMDTIEGRNWTYDDVPSIVLTVFMIISDMIIFVNQAMPVVKHKKFSKRGETFVLVPRSTIIIKEYCQENMASADTFGSNEKLEIPLDYFRRKSETMVLYERQKKQQSSLKWYINLHEALKQDQCQILTILFLKGKFTMPTKHLGLDVGISRVIELLRCVSEGKEKAEISILRNLREEEDYTDDDDSLITSEELKNLLASSV